MKLLKSAALLATAAIISCTSVNQDTAKQQANEQSPAKEKEEILHSIDTHATNNFTGAKDSDRIFKRTISLDFEKDSTIVEYPPGCLQEMPQNIVEHLERKGIASYYENDIYDFSRKNIAELQRFKEGKRKFFPQKEVEEAVLAMADGIRISYHYNDAICTDSLQNLIYELTDIAVNLVPDINLISGCCSKDHRIGFIDYLGSYMEGYFCYSIIYKAAEGKYKAHTLDIVDRAAPLTTIRKIAEGEGKATYIISAEDLYCSSRACYTPFVLYVIDIFDNGTVQSYKPINSEQNIEEWLTLFRNLSANNNYKHEKIVFNPQKLVWEICSKDKDVYKKIEGTKTLNLEFPNGTPTLTLN